jgi:hypothetical protein
MTTPVTDEQLQAIKRRAESRFAGNANEFTHERAAYLEACDAVSTLLRAISERDATIAELRGKLSTQDFNIAAYINREQSMALQIADLHSQLAELRKPVAVERNERVEQIRLEHLAASPVQEMPTWQYTYDIRRDLLSAYDTLAQNAASDASARDAMLADMRGMRERMERYQMMHSQAEDQLNEYIFKTKAAEERERKLREHLQWILDMSAGWDSLGSTGPRKPLSWESVGRMSLDYARAALAQPQADEPNQIIEMKCTTITLENGTEVNGSFHEGDYWWSFVTSEHKTPIRLRPETMQAMVAIYALLLRDQVEKESSADQPQAEQKLEHIYSTHGFDGRGEDCPACKQENGNG